MTKRLTAWALALLLIVACFAFTACKDEKTENSSEDASENSETSVPEVTPLTPKEMYENAYKNTYSFLKADWANSDAFNYNGYAIIDKNSNQKIEFNVTADKKNKLCSGEIGLCADDEKAIINLAANESAVYWNIKDVTELPVKNDISNTIPSENEEKINELIQKAQSVLNIIAEACNGDVVNDLYKTETGDITIDGVEYTDETLVTFELDNEKLEAIVEAIKTKINENDDAKAFIEEIKEILEGESDEESDEESNELSDFIEKIKYTLSCKITAVIREDKIAASENDISFGLEYDGTKAVVSINEVQNGNNKKGEVSVSMHYSPKDYIDDSAAVDVKVSIPYTAVYSDNGFTFTSTEIVIDQGMKLSLPFDFSVSVECGENSIKYSLNAKMIMQETGFDVEVSFTLSKCDTPEVKIPEEFITEEELGDDTLEAFLEKYPSVAAAFGSIFQSPYEDYITD